MAGSNSQKQRGAAVWSIAARQHGQITREQLVGLGYTRHAIAHRLARGRLHRTRRDVYAVGRPIETRKAEWMAAVLTGGAGTYLSHGSASALWRIRGERERTIHISVPPGRQLRQPSLVAHRRSSLAPEDVTAEDGIPLTTPVRTLIDLSTRLAPRRLEAAINQADKLDLVDPETLRAEIAKRAGLRGAARLRRLVDRSTSPTDSELERAFIPLAIRAALPMPLTQHHMHGFRSDWP